MTVRTPHVVKDDRHWLNPPTWWKKFKPLRWLAIFTIIGGLTSGFWSAKTFVLAPADNPDTPRFTAIESPQLSLGANTFTSYAPMGAITARLDKDHVAWSVISNHAPKSERYPPRNVDIVQADAYTHLGVKGKLVLSFFNDRLYEVYFEPESKDAADYSTALFKVETGLKRNRIGKVEMVDGSRRVATNVDLVSSDVGRSLRTKAFAVWQDLRLVRQQKEWDDKYGGIPLPARGKDD